jgi:3-deoxy-D-manno-octulosonic-acid transferase
VIFIYNIVICFYSFAVRLAAIAGKEKAQKWINGRKDIFSRISAVLKPGEKRVWFHCSSLGEFEQGRPVMEKLRMQNPELRIVLTFFSPSGFEIRKNYAGADYIFYLPTDTAGNAKRFIELVNPEKVFFVKYDFWYHYFRELNRKGIPLYMISVIFRNDQAFFKWYGGLFRRMLKYVTHFFVQDAASMSLLEGIGFTNATINGDTRFDRVSTIAAEAKMIPLVDKFKAGKTVFIAGSSWEQDEELIIPLITDYAVQIDKYIIAPHEIGRERVADLYNKLSEKTPGIVMLFSKADEAAIATARVLIIDNIGMLSSLYRYGNLAYIGGGFGKGIHNTLEAAVFGMPLFFGPNYHKFKEAIELINAGGAFTVDHYASLQAKVKTFLADQIQWKSACEASLHYVKQRTGATDRILKKLNVER